MNLQTDTAEPIFNLVNKDSLDKILKAEVL